MLHARILEAAGMEVQDGNVLRPADYKPIWAEVGRRLAARLLSLKREQDPEYMLPWTRKNDDGTDMYKKSGSTSRAIYAHLALAHAEDIVRMEEHVGMGDSCFGMIRCFVSADKRDAFDARLFPSLAHAVDQKEAGLWTESEVKTLRKQWQTAGWNETVLAGHPKGTLVFEYSVGRRKRKLEQQTRRGGGRKRKAGGGDHSEEADDGEQEGAGPAMVAAEGSHAAATRLE